MNFHDKNGHLTIIISKNEPMYHTILGYIYQNDNIAINEICAYMFSALLSEKGLSNTNKHLLTEISQTTDGSMEISYFPIPDYKLSDGSPSASLYPQIYEFDDLEDLIDACMQIADKYNYLYQSSLFFHNHKYHITVSALGKYDSLVCNILSQYGTYMGSDTVLGSHINECERLIARNNAVEKINRYFSGK